MQSYSSLIYSRPSFKNITNELEIKTDQSKNNNFDENLIINYKDFQKLSFQNLSFKYDRNYIFKDLNFSLKKIKLLELLEILVRVNLPIKYYYRVIKDRKWVNHFK